MESDLSDRYNTGVMPPPDQQVEGEQIRLPRSAYRPTPAQVRTARWQLAIGIALLALFICACLAVAWGWRA